MGADGDAEARAARIKAALADLPPASTRRWVIRRKAAVVAAVAVGALTIEEACDRYLLSAEELASWRQAIEHHGLRGLRTTRLQEYRARDRAAREPERHDTRQAGAAPRALVPDGALV
jgi:hypothetical protein